MQLRQHSNGAHIGQMSLDQAMKWNIRFQILCLNQEEKDLLDAYQLMYGREVQVDIWREWLAKERAHSAQGKRLRLLPTVFTTMDVAANLRGR